MICLTKPIAPNHVVVGGGQNLMFAERLQFHAPFERDRETTGRSDDSVVPSDQGQPTIAYRFLAM